MRIFALMRGKSDTEIAMICQWDNQAIELLYDRYYRALVSMAVSLWRMKLQKTSCRNFSLSYGNAARFSAVFPSFPPICIIRCTTRLLIICAIKTCKITIGRA